jgi:predicted nucleic acid-binding protein
LYKNPCFDSSVFLGGLNNEIVRYVKRGVVYRYLIDKAKDGEFKIHISTVAIAEVYRAKDLGMASGSVLDDFMSLLEDDLIETIEVDRTAAIIAHKLCRTHGGALRPFDALHLACAQAAHCDYLLSWDGPLSKITHDSVLIKEPSIYERSLITESEQATPEEQATWYSDNPRRYRQLGPDLQLISTFSCGGGI